VRSEDVAQIRYINTLHRRCGPKSPLKRNSYFERSPHPALKAGAHPAGVRSNEAGRISRSLLDCVYVRRPRLVRRQVRAFGYELFGRDRVRFFFPLAGPDFGPVERCQAILHFGLFHGK
jgi:hypothetical protein